MHTYMYMHISYRPQTPTPALAPSNNPLDSQIKAEVSHSPKHLGVAGLPLLSTIAAVPRTVCTCFVLLILALF